MEEETANKKRKRTKRVIVPSRSNAKWGYHLPLDIIPLIMEKLSFADQARFLTVWGTWEQKHMGPFPSPAKQLPWQFNIQYNYRYDGSRIWLFTLYDPIYGKTYAYDDARFSMYLNSYSLFHFLVKSPVIRDSKDGWLLLSLGEGRRWEQLELFFYNPFYKEQIILPDALWVGWIGCATCSSSPTSSDCIVFVIHHHDVETTSISSCHPWDDKWEITTSVPMIRSSYESRIIYLDGMLYLSDGLKMIIFDRSCNILSQVDFPNSPVFYPSVNILSRCYKRDIVVFGGEILLLCLYYPQVWKILLFKLVDGLWVRVESLGDRALVVADCYSILLEASDLGQGMEADWIYYTNNHRFFDLKKGQRVDDLSWNYPLQRNCCFPFIGYLQPPVLFPAE